MPKITQGITRLQAAGMHLVASVIIASTILIAMLFVWYPGAYFKLMGGGKLIFLLFAVDVCLGPLLTLAVFKSGKKHLKFDLAAIVLLQLVAFLYGASILFQSRPVFTVFTVDQFRVASGMDLKDVDLEKAPKPEWRKRPLLGPVVVAANMPHDEKEKNELKFLAVAGLDIDQFPKLYVDYAERRLEILKLAQPLSRLRELHASNSESVSKFLRDRKQPQEDFVFVPLRGRMDFMAAILDANTGDFIDVIDANPYRD